MKGCHNVVFTIPKPVTSLVGERHVDSRQDLALIRTKQFVPVRVFGFWGRTMIV
jgi:hypothetical protein